MHDETSQPSQGRLLRDVIDDPRLRNVIVDTIGDGQSLPEIVLENVWNEKFRIEFVMLPSNLLAAHAVLID